MKRRAEVYKLGPTWLLAQEDGKFWVADFQNGWIAYYVRFHTHAEALAHALAEVGLDRPAEHREAP